MSNEPVGGLVGQSNDIVINNCYNSGNIRSHGIVGGLIGNAELRNTTIINSYNDGDVIGRYIGGLIGVQGAIWSNNENSNKAECIIDSSFNSGNLGGIVVGGFISNSSTNLSISNSYNTGDIDANKKTYFPGFFVESYSSDEYASGVVGQFRPNNWSDRWNVKIDNVYIAGNIISREYTLTQETGYDDFIVIGTSRNSNGLAYGLKRCIKDGYVNLSVSNFSYIDTISSLDYTEYAKPLSTVKSDAFLNSLNTKQILFSKDLYYINKGYPIFKWQLGEFEYNWNIENKEIANFTLLLDGSSIVLQGLKKGTTILHVSIKFNNKAVTKKITITVVNPAVQTKEGYFVIGEEVEYITGYNDDDKDPKYRDEFKYVHTPNRLEVGVSLDNTLGAINYNDKWLGDSVKTFAKVGAYEVNYRVQDNPPTANKLNFENYRYYSEPVKTTIYIHRKPTAFFTLENNIVTDSSYDLDHSISYSNKGIVKWEWTYINDNGKILTYAATDKTTGVNTVNNWLNTNLGTNYELLLRVQDMELVWSEVYSTNIKGEIEFSANLRTELDKFDLMNGIPASENLLAFDIWTKYPEELKLQLVLCDTLGKEVAAVKEVLYSTATATKMGQDTYWNDVKYNIPATLKCGKYIMKIKAIDLRDVSVFKEIPFDVTVKTPINLQPIMPSEIRAGKEILIKATTSKYVNSAYSGSGVKVTLFEGTSYARTLTMIGITTNWDITTTLDKTIPQGVYKAKFVATLPSGEFEVKELTYNYVVNTAPVITDGEIFAELGGNFIYENDDVNFRLKFHDVDLSNLTVNVNLFKSDNLSTPIKSYSKVVSPNGSTYDDYIVRLIDDIPLGDYRVVASITDDYNESATIIKDFTAHDLWVKGSVTHAVDWEKNRQTYNAKYPSKTRSEDTYWNGESLETSANTTIINPNSNVVCNKVSVEVINNDKPSDNRYLQWLNSDNITNDKWSLSYWDKEWVSKDGYVITKWGSDKKQELTLRFTAYFNNDWVEITDVKIYIDTRDDYWKLHRAW